jgi:hypothetical protein
MNSPRPAPARLRSLLLAALGLSCSACLALAQERRPESASPGEGAWSFEYVGAVVNGSPSPTASQQFGLLQGMPGAGPGQVFTFFTEATTAKATSQGPVRIIDRTGTTTVYLASAPGDFAEPASFRAGRPVQAFSLVQQVVLDTTTGVFTVVNLNTPAPGSTRDPADPSGGRPFRSVLTGRLNAPGGSPTGWFGGYALALPR